MKFSNEDLAQIGEHGLTPGQVEEQIEFFKKGFPYVNLDRPAKIGDGILKPDNDQKEELVRFFEEGSGSLKLMKFVPASGAASRMFKQLYYFRDNYKTGNTRELSHGRAFIQNIGKFPFYEEVREILASKGTNLENLLEKENYKPIFNTLLEEGGMNYGETPKALIKFHRRNGEIRTSIEEQLVEGAEYCKDNNGVVRIHFTISPEHRERVMEFIDRKRKKYEDRFGVTYDITYSVQKPSTDTVAVTPDNALFRQEDNKLLFRPAGHGALLENLGLLDADLIFIKNIDNVQPDRLKKYTIEYKKLLGAYLLRIRDQIFSFLKKADEDKVTGEDITHMINFAEDLLQWKIPDDLHNDPKALFNLFNRPIRVCGMVKNQGEPGGGPFWVRKGEEVSLQIIEKAQVDPDNENQQEILNKATHFNPVDLVCSIKDYEGNTFDLKDFRDNNTGFISLKSKDGKELKALELPGLWNGAMADWITVFVEVPLETFSPVKTVNDLLRDEHLD